MIITLRALVDAGFCRSGVQRWCIMHGVDFARLARGELDDSELSGIDCGLMRKAIEKVQNNGR